MPGRLSTGFCGYPATQLLADYWLWEHILNETSGLTAIVELGTAYGGFSLFLATQAHYRGLGFGTFDSIDHATAPLEQLFGRPAQRPPVAPLGEAFRRVELVKDDAATEVLAMLGGGPVALFCDNGHKAQEVAIYSPHLATGSLCVVHDWGEEIGPVDVPLHLQERYGALCDEIGSMSRVFERV